jgi:FdhE protein
MTMEAAHHSHIQIGSGFPLLIFPHADQIFLDRSRRFANLSEGHSLADWLRFLGILTLTQHHLLQEYQFLPLPDEKALTLARENRLPTVPVASWPRDPSWWKVLAGLARKLLPHAPPPAQDTLKRLLAMDGMALEALADRVLCMEFKGGQADCLPFVAAALQVYWTALAAGLKQMKIAPLDIPGVCPCCGFLPVASVVRTDGEVARLRYLHCALCNTEWHLERVVCATCRDNNRIAYHFIEGGDEAVRAETCDACKSYLKILYREKSPQADPVADDLATLVLDILVDKKHYNRMGPNLLFIPSGSNGFHASH